MGIGSANFHEGKRAVSDSTKGSTSEVWKVGWTLGEFGRSSVTVE